MATSFFSSVNYLSVFSGALAYFILGAVWFSAIFGKIWAAEHERRGIKIVRPSQGGMITKMVISFIGNLVIAFAVAFMVHITDSCTMASAIKVALFASIGVAAPTLAIAYNWEGKSCKLYLIDAGYTLAGIFICAIIIAYWRCL